MRECLEDDVWCDVHMCIHEKTTDPYDMGYELSGESPECFPCDWRILWVGAAVAPYSKPAIPQGVGHE